MAKKIVWKNAHVVSGLKELSKANEGTAAPLFNAMRDFALAYSEEAFGDRNDFVEIVQSLRANKNEPTLAENRISERWNIVRLGEYKCVAPLFANLAKMKKSPSITALADIAACIRGSGPWASNGEFAEAKVRAWPKERTDAPTADAITTMMTQGNKARNKTKTDNGPRTDADVIDSAIKALTRINVREHGPKDHKVPALNSSDVTSAIKSLTAAKAAMSKPKNGKSNVVKMPTRKAA
jgi:hypothetical protein